MFQLTPQSDGRRFAVILAVALFAVLGWESFDPHFPGSVGDAGGRQGDDGERCSAIVVAGADVVHPRGCLGSKWLALPGFGRPCGTAPLFAESTPLLQGPAPHRAMTLRPIAPVRAPPC